MQLIKNRADFAEFFPYNVRYLSNTYSPLRYPCYCSKQQMDGGITGDYWRISYYYVPTDINNVTPHEAFAMGMNAKPTIKDI